MLENSLEVPIIGSGYAHKVCNNNARQERELQGQKMGENGGKNRGKKKYVTVRKKREKREKTQKKNFTKI